MAALARSLTHGFTRSKTRALASMRWGGGVVPAGVVRPTTPDYSVYEQDTWLNRGAGLTGVTAATNATRKFSISMWLKSPTLNNGVAMEYFRSLNAVVRVQRTSANKILVQLSQGANILSIVSTQTFVIGSAPVHIAVSMDASFSPANVAKMYINGVLDTTATVVDPGAAINVSFTGETNWTWGGAFNGSNPMRGGMVAEGCVWIGTFIDWSDAPTLAKVYNAGAMPDLGADASIVTGTAPTIYCSIRPEQDGTAWLHNRGTGGDFTVGAGAAICERMAQVGYGDSLMDGSLASPLPASCARFIQSRNGAPASGVCRFDYDGGVGGQPIHDDGSGDPTRWIQGRFTLDFPTLKVRFNHSKSVWIIEGGYNDRITVANAGGLANILNAAKIMRDTLLAWDPDVKWYVEGAPTGGQRTIAQGAVAAEEEYTGGIVAGYLAQIESAFTTEFGTHFFSPQAYLATQAALDTASGLGFDVTTNAVADIYDLAHGVVPTSLRSVATVSDFPGRSYGIHWNNAGHRVKALGSLAFRQNLYGL